MTASFLDILNQDALYSCYKIISFLYLEQVEGQFSHYGQSPGLEWRFSFSQAELLLSDSVPTQARSAYLAFKAVVKKHVNRYA